MRRLVLAGLAVALCLPAAAWAHASLVGTTPDFQQRLERSPKVIRLDFDQVVSDLLEDPTAPRGERDRTGLHPA